MVILRLPMTLGREKFYLDRLEKVPSFSNIMHVHVIRHNCVSPFT